MPYLTFPVCNRSENTTLLHSLAISPDGRYLALAAEARGKRQLWLRPLDALEAQAMPSTEDATFPFWSPDSRYIGFFAQGKLKKIAVSGGPAQALCDVIDARGGSWNRDGVIVFSPSGNGGTAIQRISASGGVPVDVTGHIEGGPSRFPVFLPDGRHFLYSQGLQRRPDEAGLRISSLDGKENRRVLADQSSAVIAPGRLLFVRDKSLMAQPFDMTRGEALGEAFPVADGVSRTTNIVYAPLTASETGVLVYQRGTEADGGSQLTWYDRGGKMIGTAGNPDRIGDVALSADERSAVYTRVGGAKQNLWLMDLVRGTAQRLTNNFLDLRPHSSDRGDRVVFSSSRTGVWNLYQRPATGTGQDELLLATENPKFASQWSSDGRFVVYSELDPTTKFDLWVLPLGEGREQKPIPFLRSAFNEYSGRLTRDNHWMAYASDESGQTEVYVRQFPSGEGQWKISITGGGEPTWRGDGRELYFLTPKTVAVIGKRPVPLHPHDEMVGTRATLRMYVNSSNRARNGCNFRLHEMLATTTRRRQLRWLRGNSEADWLFRLGFRRAQTVPDGLSISTTPFSSYIPQKHSRRVNFEHKMCLSGFRVRNASRPSAARAQTRLALAASSLGPDVAERPRETLGTAAAVSGPPANPECNGEAGR